MGFIKNSIVIVYIVFNIIQEVPAPGERLSTVVTNCIDNVRREFNNHSNAHQCLNYAFTGYNKSRLDSKNGIIGDDLDYFDYLTEKANTNEMLDTSTFCNQHFQNNADSCIDELDNTYRLEGGSKKVNFLDLIYNWVQSDLNAGTFIRSYFDHMMEKVTLVGDNIMSVREFCIDFYKYGSE